MGIAPKTRQSFRVGRLSFGSAATGFATLYTVAGAPTNGTSGTLAGIATPGSILVDTTNKTTYQNTNTQASPTWTLIANVAAGVQSITSLQATMAISVGGTGVPGAAAVETKITKAVTAFTDTVAKTVFTVTVPNAAHAAIIDLDFCGVLGAGGAIGAGEASRISKYQLVLARTAGVNLVATLSAAIGGAEAHVAGAANITSVVATLAAVSGAVGATNTVAVQVAITKSGGASDNHTCVAAARILNQNATGVTVA